MKKKTKKKLLNFIVSFIVLIIFGITSILVFDYKPNFFETTILFYMVLESK